jgi:hypothetical protein
MMKNPIIRNMSIGIPRGSYMIRNSIKKNASTGITRNFMRNQKRHMSTENSNLNPKKTISKYYYYNYFIMGFYTSILSLNIYYLTHNFDQIESY